MSKKIVLWLLLTLIVFISHAQHITIQGTVTDSITNEKLPYASLMVRGTTLGTATDMNGYFKLTLPNHIQTLEISYLGYDTKQINRWLSVLNLAVSLYKK